MAAGGSGASLICQGKTPTGKEGSCLRNHGGILLLFFFLLFKLIFPGTKSFHGI